MVLISCTKYLEIYRGTNKVSNNIYQMEMISPHLQIGNSLNLGD